MEIIHILNELKFSGAEIMYVDAASIFKELGCNLSVVNTASQMGEYAPYFERAGYRVFHKVYPSNKWAYIKKWKYYFKMILFLKKNNYDVVHIHSSGLKWGMSFCAWASGCKPIYTFHNVFKSNWYSYPYHCWLRWSAKHLFGCTFQTISDSVYENEYIYYYNDTIKVYNWYGSNRFYPAADGEKAIIRKELQIGKDTLVLISIGGCSHIKRHTDIIKALPEIIKKHSDVLYLHLGCGTTLEEEEELARELNLENYIRFSGNQSDVRKYLIASDIYLMTSKFEGISLTTIEAMACRIPVILYNVQGLRDFNKEAECSLLIDEDYHLLVQSVIELYKNKEKQFYLTKNSEMLVNNTFLLQTNATKIVELYKKK